MSSQQLFPSRVAPPVQAQPYVAPVYQAPDRSYVRRAAGPGMDVLVVLLGRVVGAGLTLWGLGWALLGGVAFVQGFSEAESDTGRGLLMMGQSLQWTACGLVTAAGVACLCLAGILDQQLKRS